MHGRHRACTGVDVIDPKVFKAVRKRLGLSQQELAERLSLSRVTVNKMERGRLKNGIPDEIGARLMALKPASSPAEVVTRKRYPLKPYGDGLQENAVNDKHLWDNEEDE
jgi:transcriptional regulator with XRE-family HTH domain